MAYTPLLEKYRQEVERSLKIYFARCEGPKYLLDAMGYSLFAGGKRIRPVMLLAAHDLFPSGGLDPRPAACAVEFIHTYSLIHDDLPAMDNDDLRRGKPTNHVQFGEANAILAGDALLTEAFGTLARSYTDSDDNAGIAAIAEIAFAAGSAGMVGGQVLDTMKTTHRADRAEVERIHRLKTGALIVASVRAGAVLAHAPEKELATLTRYARRVGLAFQVADDILDVVGSREALGKSIGKDEAQEKSTFVELMGLEGSSHYVRDLLEAARKELTCFGEKADALRDVAGLIGDIPSRACKEYGGSIDGKTIVGSTPDRVDGNKFQHP